MSIAASVVSYCVVDARDALVGVGLILSENGNFCFDKGMSI